MIYSLLIIDDEPIIRKLLTRMMELEGYEVFQADSREAALRQLESHIPDLILCDVFLPDGNGVEMVAEFKKKYPEVEVILLTAHGNIPDGVRAIKLGAYDYITKGDDNNKIIPVVSAALETVRKKRISAIKKIPHTKVQGWTFDSMVGQAEMMQHTIQMARKVAVTDVPVLLTGETGCGKEVFAQAIHNESNRAEAPFVAINCSSFSKDLLESELFGHKAGAFTGALSDKKGLFEEADQGTLFLDEIGEMAFELQAKLLRVLESGEYIKIGETKPTRVNVRIISATNRDLRNEIAAGNFREDLFYRLSVFQISLPALRDRVQDIPLLVRFFLEKLAAKMKMPVPEIDGACMDAMLKYRWKGNVRELRNVIERALIICNGKLTLQDLPLEIQQRDGDSSTFSEFEMAAMEQRHIIRVLKHTKGNKTEAARLLKIGLTTLYRKIEEYGISMDSL